MARLWLEHAYWRFTIVLILGFASGLPLALTGASLQAWLATDNVDIATIGFFSLVGLPYTFKFLWAPLMDRFEPPFFRRRQGWLVLTQLGTAGALAVLSTFSPSQNTHVFSLIALSIAVFSASQDIVVDAYRTDVLEHHERGFASAIYVFGYRVAMILSGGIALIWADPVKGNGWSWSQIYLIMAGIMTVVAVVSFLLLPPVKYVPSGTKSDAKADVIGFFAVVAAVIAGYQFTTRLANPMSAHLLSNSGLFPVEGTTPHPNLKAWADLLGLFMGLIVTIPLAWFASVKAKYETLNIALKNYFSMKSAVSILIFIILYKLGDAFAGSLLTPFLIKGVGFAQAEIGVVNKIIGIWLTILGALAGGALMVKLGLYRSLLFFGVLQLLSNLGFWLVASLGKGAWGSFVLPAFNLVLVSLKDATPVDTLLVFAVGIENITGGMGTAAFVALLMSLCNQKFTATQYALLSAFSAVGRVWVGPLAGAAATSIGWPTFFIISTVLAVPGIVMLVKLRPIVFDLEAPKGAALADD
jgi:PAT family beta-lactamase induction signal transducer AmpG